MFYVLYLLGEGLSVDQSVVIALYCSFYAAMLESYPVCIEKNPLRLHLLVSTLLT